MYWKKKQFDIHVSFISYSSKRNFDEENIFEKQHLSLTIYYFSVFNKKNQEKPDLMETTIITSSN